jgi:hypothetical protein
MVSAAWRGSPYGGRRYFRFGGLSSLIIRRVQVSGSSAHGFALTLTPRSAPLVNSTPAASRARWIAAIFSSAGRRPSSKVRIVVSLMSSALAANRVRDHPSSSRAVLHSAEVNAHGFPFFSLTQQRAGHARGAGRWKRSPIIFRRRPMASLKARP